MYLDTNIIIANFFPSIDSKIKQKNLINNNFFKKNKINIGDFALSEFYNILFKKTYKKIYREKWSAKPPSLKNSYKNDYVIGKVNSIFKLICDDIKNRTGKFKSNYDDMTIAIAKYKISASDYFIAKEAEGQLMTGDDDLKNYILNNFK